MKKQIHFGNKSCKNNLDYGKLNELQKRLQGTSENSNPVTDPFKFLGEFDSYDKLNGTLDTLTYSLGYQKGYGYFRARVGTMAIDIKSILVSSALNVVGQVVQGMLLLDGNKKLSPSDGTYRIYFRKHQNNVWGEWKDITAASSGGGSSSGNGDLDLSDYVTKTDTNVQHVVGGLVIGSDGTPSAMQSGKHKGRIMLTGVENPLVGVQAKNGTTPYYVQAHENNMYVGPARPNATSFDNSGNVTMPNDLSVANNIYEGGKALSAKYVSKGELSSTELAISEYVPRKINEFKETLAEVAKTGKYEDLVDKPTFKTINGHPIVGSGDLIFTGSGSSDIDFSNYVTSTALNDAIVEVEDSIASQITTVTKLIPDIKLKNKSVLNDSRIFNLEDHFKTINGNSILGSGDIDPSMLLTADMLDLLEGDGLYFNDGDDENDVGLTINCGKGLSINEETKALQINIGKGLTYDEETNAINATGSGNVDLSDYITKEEFKTYDDETNLGFINIANRVSALKYSDLNDLPTFKTINGESIFGTGDILLNGEGGTIDLSDYVTRDEFNSNVGESDAAFAVTANRISALSGCIGVEINQDNTASDPDYTKTVYIKDAENLVDADVKLDSALLKKLDTKRVYKWVIGNGDDKTFSNGEYTKIDEADIVLIQKGYNIYVADILKNFAQIVLTIKTINDSKELTRIEYTVYPDSYTVVEETIQIPASVYDFEDFHEFIETLANVATSGSYNDLNDKPTIPAEVTKDTVTGWGFTGNIGTVTGVKINGNAGMMDTKGIVDLGYIESGGGSGAYPLVNHGTSDTTFELTPNTFHVWGAMEELTLTLGAVANDVANEYLFQFTGGSGGTTLVLPGEIKWAGGTTPTIEAFKIHQVSILNNCATIQSFG